MKVDTGRSLPSECEVCNDHINYFVRSNNGTSREANSLNCLLTVSCKVT